MSVTSGLLALPAFALGAPTNVDRELTGRDAEDFETICRRYVSARPEAIPSLGNKMSALGRLLRAMLMRTPDMDAFQREQNHPPLSDAVFAKGSGEWQSSHRRVARV